MVSQNPLTYSFTGPDPSDPRHQIVTVATNDPRWPALFIVHQAQLDAVSVNNRRHDDYIEKLKAFQDSVDAGRGDGLTAPTKPRMLVVDDLGNSTEADFVPPLPGPVATPKPLPNQPGGVDPSTRPADPNVVLQMHTQMLLKIQESLARLEKAVVK